MFVKTLDDLPESLRGQFVESEFEGEKGFQHKDTIALSNALKNAKREKEEMRGKLGEFEEKLTRQEQTKAQEIEQARERALEEARSKGDVKAVEERYKQQMADLEKQVEARTREKMEKEFAGKAAQERKRSLIAELSAMGVDEDAREAMKDLLDRHIDVDPETGKEFLLDSSGGALAVDRSGFAAEIAKMRKFRHLVEASIPTKGTGAAKGSNGGGASRKPQDYTEQERVELFRTNRAEFNRLFAKS